MGLKLFSCSDKAGVQNARSSVEGGMVIQSRISRSQTLECILEGKGGRERGGRISQGHEGGGGGGGVVMAGENDNNNPVRQSRKSDILRRGGEKEGKG